MKNQTRTFAPLRHALAFAPGILLSAAVAAAALALQEAEVRIFGRAWIEALVIAILAGTLVRTVWIPGENVRRGIGFSASTVLEIAVALLGLSIGAGTVLALGGKLLLAIAAIVPVAILLGYRIGRMFGLSRELAMLVACGNAICGNSAIVAVAPAIRARPGDVAAAIAFTAVLGVASVLVLPLLAVWLAMTPQSFGIFAGLTVYAVPQVLAATAPVSSLSAQIGTLVKLVRVLMLGPVVLALALHARRTGPVAARPALGQLVPWFILAFLGLAAARSAGLVPAAVLAPAAGAATWLAILAMAALGLSTDLRAVAQAGARVAGAAAMSLLALGGAALLLARWIG